MVMVEFDNPERHLVRPRTDLIVGLKWFRSVDVAALGARLDRLGIAWSQPQGAVAWTDGAGRTQWHRPDFQLADGTLVDVVTRPNAQDRDRIMTMAAQAGTSAVPRYILALVNPTMQVRGVNRPVGEWCDAVGVEWVPASRPGGLGYRST